MRSVLFAALAAVALIPAPPARAQMSASDVVMRLEAMENQIRQLTGQIEQLQFRNQQLEQQVRRTQEDNDFRFQELGGKGTAPRGPQQAQPQQPRMQQPVQPQMQPPVQPQPIPGRRSDVDPRDNPNFVASPNPAGRRGDAFDPSANPAAPGAPRALGSLPAGQPSAPPADIAADEPVGAQGGREAGSPLDISTMAGGAASDPSLAPGRRGPAPGGTLASVSPSAQTPKELYDLGYGYIQRKDYAAAEEVFRDFLKTHARDRLAPDAQYWLGESLFQRQRYRDAAESFLQVSTKHETSGKAPDSLLRLGQSLAALREKDAACATFGEIGRKYPRASLGVKQGVEREQKRAGC